MEMGYKFVDNEGTRVKNLETHAVITKGGAHWDKYLKWITEGGVTELWKTDEQIKKMSLRSKLRELKNHLDLLSVSSVPQSNSKNQAKMISRLLKLLRKESQGRASQDEINELDQGEVLDDYLDGITDCYDEAERWLEDEVRTLVEIEDYDVTVDPQWPRLGE